MTEAVRSSGEIASHGRGGAGNIGRDETQYVDGNITRTGAVGDQGAGAYSGGRGGAGNIGSPGLNPTERKDAEAIPEAALRPSSDDQNYHVGRGGGGNIHHGDGAVKKTDTKPAAELGFADKIKNKLFKKHAEKKETGAGTVNK